MIRLLTCALICAAASGCLLDTDRECGPHMVLTPENVCTCAPDAVLDPEAFGACVPCGANQVAQAGACVCAAGFSMGADGVCITRPPGLGDACDPAAPNCPNPSFAYCLPAAGGGYCTKAACAAPADCPAGFACDTSTAGGVCKRPPTGQGVSCMSDAQCAGTDATFCTPVLNQCLVEGCVVGGTSCSQGHLCCDLTKLGAAKNVCLPLEACP